jgi:hypothetical protein
MEAVMVNITDRRVISIGKDIDMEGMANASKTEASSKYEDQGLFVSGYNVIKKCGADVGQTGHKTKKRFSAFALTSCF